MKGENIGGRRGGERPLARKLTTQRQNYSTIERNSLNYTNCESFVQFH